MVRPTYRAAVRPDDGGLVLTVGAPVGATGSAAYRRARPQPENAVWFESFYGRTVGDNPLGIDRALAASAPDVTRYWSVTDGSLPVPEGAVAGVRTQRAVVAHPRVGPGAGRQRLAALGLPTSPAPARTADVARHHAQAAGDRPSGHDGAAQARGASASSAGGTRCSRRIPTAQSIFRSAYAVRGPIWQTGYPRNDVLADAARAGWVRDGDRPARRRASCAVRAHLARRPRPSSSPISTCRRLRRACRRTTCCSCAVIRAPSPTAATCAATASST